MIETRFPPTARAGAIVLVHGAWVGEWCWEPILPALQASGRRVYPVSLRGHGTRRHESGPHIALDDHVDDVVQLVETFDLESITLVGHSYGGRVITQAWTRLAQRVAQLVYLDAHAPLGEASIPKATAHLETTDGMIPFSRFVPDAGEFGGAASVDWFMARTTPQSAATLIPDFTVELASTLQTTYVAATGEPNSPFAGYAAAAKADPTWHYHEVQSSHWLMVAQPDAVAAIILDPSTAYYSTPPTSEDAQ